jgi:CubicO group peptidase (beta-lactamase class C family)
MRFAQMLLNGGELDGVRLLSPNTINMMRRDQVGDTPPTARLTSIMLNDGIGFGLGFGTIKNQGLSGLALPEGSYFWGGAAGTFFWIDPQNELIGMFMTQLVPHRTSLRQDMWGLTYQAITDRTVKN